MVTAFNVSKRCMRLSLKTCLVCYRLRQCVQYASSSSSTTFPLTQLCIITPLQILAQNPRWETHAHPSWHCPKTGSCFEASLNIISCSCRDSILSHLVTLANVCVFNMACWLCKHTNCKWHVMLTTPIAWFQSLNAAQNHAVACSQAARIATNDARGSRAGTTVMVSYCSKAQCKAVGLSRFANYGRRGHIFALIPSQDWQLLWHSSRVIIIQPL